MQPHLDHHGFDFGDYVCRDYLPQLLGGCRSGKGVTTLAQMAQAILGIPQSDKPSFTSSNYQQP